MNASSTYGLDSVNIAFLSKSNGELPLVVSPRWDCSLSFLIQWCRHNRFWLDQMILKCGAVLFRGFDLDTPSDMEVVIRAYQPRLSNTYRGTSPRKLQDGTDFVFSAAEVPTNYPIAQHLEMSFLDAPPRQLYFGCMKPSKTAGGETSLADFRKVFQDIPNELKEKLFTKGVRYTRTHKKVGSYFSFDVSDMLGWPDLFGTSDKAEVERICAEEGVPVKWEGPNKDIFVSTTLSHAYQYHPVTKEIVWFNHIQVFHWSTFPAELFFAFKRTLDIRFLLHCMVLSVVAFIKYVLLGHKMSLDCSFGDGEPISYAEMSQIRTAIHKNMVFSRWEKGDLLFIDNFSTSHGRQPTYDKGRKVVVAWADPLQKANLVTSLTAVPETIFENESSICLENPQEKSPQSTLTKTEVNTLQEGLLDKDLIQKLQEISNEHDQRSRKAHRKNHSEPIHLSDPNFWKEDD